METVALDTSALAAATDFSLWALFIRADIVVKLVMIGLIFSSVWSWAIILRKTSSGASTRRQRISNSNFGRETVAKPLSQGQFGLPTQCRAFSLPPCASLPAARRVRRTRTMTI